MSTEEVIGEVFSKVASHFIDIDNSFANKVMDLFSNPRIHLLLYATCLKF